MSGSGSKASRHLAEEPAFQDLLERCRSFPGEVHPKVGIVGELVQRQLEEHPESRIIVFATFRDTVQQLVNHLADIGIESERVLYHFTELLEDVTALLHTGSCAERPGLISCTCGRTGVGTHRRLRAMPPGGGPIPTLTPDPSAETDPWHDALVDFVARFRGRGTSRRSPFNHEGDTSVRDRRQLMSHLELLASTFAGAPSTSPATRG